VSDVISDLVKSGENLNRQFITNTKDIQISRVVTENINLIRGTNRITKRIINNTNVLILDHPTQGFLDDKLLAGEDSVILIWNHPEQGQWDNFQWAGDGNSAFGEPEVIRVLNTNNTFIERVLHNDFIDSTTTANVDYTINKVSFVGNQFFLLRL